MATEDTTETTANGTDSNDYTVIPVIETTRTRLRSWKEQRDCTYDEAIRTLLDRADTDGPLTLPDDPPPVDAVNADSKVNVSIRADTRQRLKLWKTRHGYTYTDAIEVLLDLVAEDA